MEVISRESKRYLGVALDWRHLTGIAVGGAFGWFLFRYGRLIASTRRMWIPMLINRFTGHIKEVSVLDYVVKNAIEGDPESVLATIDEFAMKKEWMMNVGDEKGEILDKAVKDMQPKVMLEFGAYCGYSAVRIARLLPEGSMLYSFEFNPLNAAIATKVVEHAGFQNKVKIIVGTVEQKLHTLKSRYGVAKVDAIFVDHWKDRYLPDIKLVEEAKLLRKGSIVIADNVIFPGTPQYLEYVRHCDNYESVFHEAHLEYSTEIIDGIEISTWVGPEDD